MDAGVGETKNEEMEDEAAEGREASLTSSCGEGELRRLRREWGKGREVGTGGGMERRRDKERNQLGREDDGEVRRGHQVVRRQLSDVVEQI